MSSKIIKATVYTNGEVAYLSWRINEMIPGCLGFEITRLYPDDPAQNIKLASWVAFKGQSNPDWKPQDTGVWPVQKLSWRDLTLIRKRDELESHPEGFRVQYRIRPVVAWQAQLEAVEIHLPVTYTGTPKRLSYVDGGIATQIVNVGNQYGDVRATFTNGILASQWLSNVLKLRGEKPLSELKKAIKDKNDPIRKYLTGQVSATLRFLLEKAGRTQGASLKMALYEFEDKELFDAVYAVKDKVDIILSNTAADKAGNWDGENEPFRAKLKEAGVNKTDRYFNNGKIGHNKFVIYLENGVPKSVMTGSTNWTASGLCTQSNNAVIIDSEELAKQYEEYFDAMKTDTGLFTLPDPTSDKTNNSQGSVFRLRNKPGNKPVILSDGTQVTVWFSPNTLKKNTDKEVIPPDLSAVYSLMRKAEKAIFFAVFMPGYTNNMDASEVMTNIISEAITIGGKDESLLVYGAISNPSAMPNAPKSKPKDPAAPKPAATEPKVNMPATYDRKNVHLVRATGFTSEDVIGDFEKELLSAGHAIIHDKIVVIDPFSENGAVIFGSHNLGFKASYENDENLIIIKNNPALIQAYAVHVLDIYEHYRYRAVQQEIHDQGKPEWDGFLSVGDGWLEKALEVDGKADLATYMCE